MDIQNGKQAVEDDGEEDGVPDDDDGIAGMVTPKRRFLIGGKAESYRPTRQIVDPPGKFATSLILPLPIEPWYKGSPSDGGGYCPGGEFRKWKTSRTRITPPRLSDVSAIVSKDYESKQ